MMRGFPVVWIRLYPASRVTVVAPSKQGQPHEKITGLFFQEAIGIELGELFNPLVRFNWEGYECFVRSDEVFVI